LALRELLGYGLRGAGFIEIGAECGDYIFLTKKHMSTNFDNLDFLPINPSAERRLG
jgi:hypothetical protein